MTLDNLFEKTRYTFYVKNGYSFDSCMRLDFKN